MIWKKGKEFGRFPKIHKSSINQNILTIWEVLKTFSRELPDEIKWIEKTNYKDFISDLRIISEDVFTGTANRLYKGV